MVLYKIFSAKGINNCEVAGKKIQICKKQVEKWQAFIYYFISNYIKYKWIKHAKQKVKIGIINFFK